MSEPASTLAHIFAAHTEALPAVALHDGTHRRAVIGESQAALATGPWPPATTGNPCSTTKEVTSPPCP